MHECMRAISLLFLKNEKKLLSQKAGIAITGTAISAKENTQSWG